MARIFNMYFTYDSFEYTAVVSVRTTPFFTEYTLSNVHDALLELLPGNRIVSTGPHHFVFPDAGAQSSSALMNAIIRAVSEHLKATIE